MSRGEEENLEDIHEQFENFRFLPRIEGMKVEEYIINININNRICMIKNKVTFKPVQATNYNVSLEVIIRYIIVSSLASIRQP